MGELKQPIWGKPTLYWGNTPLEIPQGATNLMMVEENDIKEDGMIFHVPDPKPISFSFDIDVSKETIKNLRKLFKYRIPRKTKKRFKCALAKRLGIKTRKLMFNMQVLNDQKRRKRYGKKKL